MAITHTRVCVLHTIWPNNDNELQMNCQKKKPKTNSQIKVELSRRGGRGGGIRWPSGLRRWIKAPVRKGVGSNPILITKPFSFSFSIDCVLLFEFSLSTHTLGFLLFPVHVFLSFFLLVYFVLFYFIYLILAISFFLILVPAAA